MSQSDRRSSPAQPLDGGAHPAPSADGSMVVHTRARELLGWLVPHTVSWPREQRHAVTQHVLQLALGIHDALIAARHGDAGQRAASLREADIRLDQLRGHLQLAWQWTWMSDGQYQHASRMTAELGRLIGGWRRGPRSARS